MGASLVVSAYWYETGRVDERIAVDRLLAFALKTIGQDAPVRREIEEYREGTARCVARRAEVDRRFR